MQNKKDWIAVVAVILILAIIGVLFLWYFPSLEKKQEEALLKEAYEKLYAERIASYEAENPSLVDVDAVFLGDSLTEGYDLSTHFPQLKTVNRGIGGDTTFGLENRLKVSLYDLNPRAVILLIGANNLDTMFHNYQAVLEGIAEHLPNARVVILSLLPTAGAFADRNEQIAFNNVKIQALAKLYGFTYVDAFSALLDCGKDELHADCTTDGAHLTPLGYQILTELLTPLLSDLPKLPAESETTPATETESTHE
ncbi:MAG: hypothetical protein IKA76_08805 [Clostridia bacterium]|nr:hypothetical protein [Clostridia bacterium]